MVDLKELKKLIKYLRKEGVTEFKSDGLEFKLAPESPKAPRKGKSTPSDVSEQVHNDPGLPSEEEMLFWSAGGPPPKDT